ncbi:hypothetical protein [Thermosulfurimonas sp. F29]|uniref:hypothetical protein n=1 Tax=Thermosulfurimonas sp. F29 TaxID=2867247 RepID=UPI001C82AB34|nr:hypothetical protein [Thermosulfurimonas sp. F29]MBX6423038.1 hypothetical protein [Thermosulfurimonas sp. F29]
MRGKRRGFVLVSTLIYTLAALVMVLGVSLLMFYGARFSGSLKRYSTALEAARGEALVCLEEIRKACARGDCPSPPANPSHSVPEDLASDYYHRGTYGNYDAYCKIIDRRFFIVRFYHVEVAAFKPGTQDYAWLAVGYELK